MKITILIAFDKIQSRTQTLRITNSNKITSRRTAMMSIALPNRRVNSKDACESDSNTCAHIALFGYGANNRRRVLGSES